MLKRTIRSKLGLEHASRIKARTSCHGVHLPPHHLRLIKRLLPEHQAEGAPACEQQSKVIAQGGEVGNIQGGQVHAPLQHGPEAWAEAEWDLAHNKATEEEADCCAHDDLWKQPSQIFLHHVHHESGVCCHGLVHCACFRSLIENTRCLLREILLPQAESALREEVCCCSDPL